ncbi:3-hydroxybutyryl-CoA dehydrogenase [Streptomyces diastatochromogenes]|uniref:3-hydroxybutyryl-CoA dehydrogenase n=1 Tax=Streptomyces diastatochromogenes TaxID=42236 RepID=A0A233RVA9_STRDA|nr:3-hydroxybutyryl-CoA dehydrogenase [Streptomyces diastatochromogenes]MCZ0990652.1 3-hydroxybutyryl-CoA dehydrogenase [Streptomyces diastatochromogenes]OXY87331.1 3-hydroxybutyryl-CoA dehydrogenase [Streptomyces diastatochromogenes]
MSVNETREGIERVGVVGSGIMGAGIAELCAKAGCDVRVAVSSDRSLQTGPTRVARSLDRAVNKGKITPERRDEVLGRIAFTRDLGELSDRQLVIEAVKEDETLKLDLFASLDKIVQSPDAIFASNTSSLSIARLAQATGRPEHVIGLHFFNPAPVLPLVEIVDSITTDPQVSDRTEEFIVERLGKSAIKSPDRAGFVVNALLFPYLLSAIRMVDSGLATADVVDQGMTLGCSHPLGPLRLADLIGLDTTVSIAEAMYEEFKEPLYAPPGLLLRMVEAGRLGKKSGRGFYTYA